MDTMAVDGNKLQELINKVFGDVGAAMGAASTPRQR